jgi:hypothetical protein
MNRPKSPWGAIGRSSSRRHERVRRGFPHGGSDRWAAGACRADTPGVDSEPWRAAWAGWTVPAAVRGLVPAGALSTPAEALQALLSTAIRRLTGRRFTVPGTGGLALRVEALEMHPDPLGVALGQFDDVQLVARDVEWRGWACDRVVVTFRNVHLRPLPTAAVVTAPVVVEIALAPAIVAARLAAVRPGAVFEIE